MTQASDIDKEFVDLVKDKSHGQRAYDLVTDLCHKYGPRPSGSGAEEDAARDIEEELQKHGDEVMYETFEARPGLYPRGFVHVAGTLMFIGLFFLFTRLAWLTPILVFVGLFVFFTELCLLKRWIKFLFKAQPSQNVIAKIKPKKDPRMKIVCAGHIDSAWEMKITRFEDKIVPITFVAIVFVLVTFLTGIVKAIWYGVDPAAIVVSENAFFAWTLVDWVYLALFIPLFPCLLLVLYGYGFSPKVPVVGANDNLVGVTIAVELARFFSQHRPDHVELWLGGFGCEEIGDRGSYNFVKKHGPPGELDDALAIIPESCGAAEEFVFLTKEAMHFVNHHPEAYNALNAAYQRYAATEDDPIPGSVDMLPFAGSDAGMFSEAGYKASTLLGASGAAKKPANWHAVTDVPENLEVPTIQAVFEILAHLVRLKDEEMKRRPAPAKPKPTPAKRGPKEKKATPAKKKSPPARKSPPTEKKPTPAKKGPTEKKTTPVKEEPAEKPAPAKKKGPTEKKPAPAKKTPPAKEKPEDTPEAAPEEEEEEPDFELEPDEEIDTDEEFSIEDALLKVFHDQGVIRSKKAVLDAVQELLPDVARSEIDKIFTLLKKRDRVSYSRSKPVGYSLTD